MRRLDGLTDPLLFTPVDSNRLIHALPASVHGINARQAVKGRRTRHILRRLVVPNISSSPSLQLNGANFLRAMLAL